MARAAGAGRGPIGDLVRSAGVGPDSAAGGAATPSADPHPRYLAMGTQITAAVQVNRGDPRSRLSLTQPLSGRPERSGDHAHAATDGSSACPPATHYRQRRSE